MYFLFISIHSPCLFVDSNSFISVTIHSYTRVHMNLFSSEWSIVSFPKILTFPPDHPV